MKGIVFDGKHSYKDFNLTMTTNPVITYPQKNKKKTRIPGTNYILDLDEGRNTQEYTERQIVCTFNVINHSKMDARATEDVASALANWLMIPVGKQRLDLDIIPYFYFEAEVESVGDLVFNVMQYGQLEVTFTCMPFKKFIYPEGHGLYFPLNFNYDVQQDVVFDMPSLTNEILPFRQLKIGDMVTLGGWTSIQSGYTGRSNKIRPYETEPFYEIINKKSYTTNVSQGWYGNTEYQLDNGYWVRDQNIIQCRNVYKDITLRNVNNHPVIPEITFTPSTNGSAWRGITIQRGNNFYNLRGDTPNQNNYHNDIFQLMPGENNIKVYGQDNTIEFIWRKEML